MSDYLLDAQVGFRIAKIVSEDGQMKEFYQAFTAMFGDLEKRETKVGQDLRNHRSQSDTSLAASDEKALLDAQLSNLNDLRRRLSKYTDSLDDARLAYRKLIKNPGGRSVAAYFGEENLGEVKRNALGMYVAVRALVDYMRNAYDFDPSCRDLGIAALDMAQASIKLIEKNPQADPFPAVLMIQCGPRPPLEQPAGTAAVAAELTKTAPSPPIPMPAPTGYTPVNTAPAAAVVTRGNWKPTVVAENQTPTRVSLGGEKTSKPELRIVRDLS